MTGLNISRQSDRIADGIADFLGSLLSSRCT
jgi:hypothetical protein